MMKSNRYVFGKASIRFLITLILGFLIPVPVVGIIMAPFDPSTAFDPSLLFGPLLGLIYTIPIWFGMSLLGFFTDLMIVSSEISLKRFIVIEWLISIVIPIWPIIENFSFEFPSRWLVYFYFVLLSLFSFYLKGKYLVRKGVISSVIA
jgi:hypothetical protein